MKVGDLVRYDKSLSGLENCMGVIIGVNGQAFVVQWFDSNGRLVHKRTGTRETSVEMPEFLEVASENR